MIENCRIIWLAGCLLLAATTPATATAADDLPDLGALDDSALFADIPSVFGASKYEQRLTEAPASVTIVTADEIRKYGYRNLEDILDSVRGFYTTNDRNYAYPGVRGFNRPGDYGTRILLLLDGQRLNDALYDAAAIDREFPVDVDLVDRVEIIRGPGSSIYGSNAVLAVINVITRRGRDYKGGELAASYGSHDTREGRASYGDRFGNGLEVLLSGTGYDSDGDDHLYFPEFDDPSTNNGVAVDGDDEKTRSLFAKLSFGDFTLQADYNDRDKRFPTASYDTVFNDRRNRTDDRYAHVFLGYSHSFDNEIEVNADINYGYYKYYGAYVYDYSTTAVPDLVIWDDDAKTEWWRYELQASIHSFDRHKLVVGAEYRDNVRLDQSNSDPFGVYLNDKSDSDVWGLYVQDEIRLADSLALTLGLRHDDYDSFGGTTNPRVALVYNPLADTTVKLLYGESFRAPNTYELKYHDGSFTWKPAVDLDPETSKSAELVLEQGIGPHLRGVVNLFYYRIDDLISLVTDPADGLLVFVNLDDVESRGLGLELEGRLPLALEGRVSYTYQDTEDRRTGEWLSNSPHHMFKLNLIAPLLAERLFAGLEYQYLSSRRTLTAADADAFSLVNLTLNAPDLWGGLSLSGSIYNLFDAHYGDVASEEHQQAEIPQDGRIFRVKAYFRF